MEKSLYKYKIEKSNIKNLINFSKCKHLSICDDEILIKCTGLQMSFKERFKSNDWILKKPLSYKYFVSTMNFEIKYQFFRNKQTRIFIQIRYWLK